MRAVAHFLNGETRVAEQLLNKGLAIESVDPVQRAQLFLQLSIIKAQQHGDFQSARQILTKAMVEARQAAARPQRDFREPSELAREVQDAAAPMLLLEQIASRMAAYCVTSAIQNWSQMRGGNCDNDSAVREVTDFMRELEDTVQQLGALPGRPAVVADRLAQITRETTGACRALTGTSPSLEQEAAVSRGEGKSPDDETGKATERCFQFERLSYPPQRTHRRMDANIHHLVQSIGGLGMGCVTRSEQQVFRAAREM